MKAKWCYKCETDKEISEFYRNRARKDGLDNMCRVCQKNKKKYPRSAQAKANAKARQESEEGKLYHQKYYQDRKELYYERNKQWTEDNRDQMRALWRKSAQKPEVKERHRKQQAKRRAKQANARLSGYDQEIDLVYNNCPINHQIDHIIPINHQDVCGLDVPWNFQYLSAKDNLYKNNRFDGTYENESWRDHDRSIRTPKTFKI